MIHRILFALLVVLTIVLQGCTPTQAITYDTKSLPSIGSANATFEAIKNLTLDIEPFGDIRETVPENGILFVRERETKIEEKDFCINAEAHYEKNTVTNQVASIMAAHLGTRGTFKRVTTANQGTADYYLTGKLRRLFGEQEVSTAAKVGSMFGLIGALATSGATTKGTIAIEFTDLVLHRKSNGAEKKLEDVNEAFAGELDADANCWCIYTNVNSQLKVVVEKLAARVENAAAELETAKP